MIHIIIITQIIEKASTILIKHKINIESCSKIIDRCNIEGIKIIDFYHKQYGIVFESMVELYNDGQLPAVRSNTSEPFPMPVNADYEISAIIMKAIAPKPEDRSASPLEMGQALVGYMQRNSINNVPITPHIPLDVDPADRADFLFPFANRTMSAAVIFSEPSGNAFPAARVRLVP
mgnify:CR=1 FL=1